LSPVFRLRITMSLFGGSSGRRKEVYKRKQEKSERTQAPSI